jgi:pimeloyl-ACP methyl ester carboxylesterase
MRAFLLSAIFLFAGCQSRAAADERPAAANEPSAITAKGRGASLAGKAAPEKSAAQGPIRVEALDKSASPPTFVLRGGPRGNERLVFLHGMCGHGLGYAQSFQFSAAKLGTLIAPQGDVTCGDVWAKWSANTEALDERVVAAFRALGEAEPIDDIIVIGMSQGATRAVALARKYPERYTRLIAMAGPSAVTSSGLNGLRGAVFMAGQRDRQDLMRGSARSVSAGRIPATFMLIPEATHGAMGPTPEKTMGEALDWLIANQRPRSGAAVSTAQADPVTAAPQPK